MMWPNDSSITLTRSSNIVSRIGKGTPAPRNKRSGGAHIRALFIEDSDPRRLDDQPGCKDACKWDCKEECKQSSCKQSCKDPCKTSCQEMCKFRCVDMCKKTCLTGCKMEKK